MPWVRGETISQSAKNPPSSEPTVLKKSTSANIAPVLPKIPSKIAKFHLKIVKNRLQFQSKILPSQVEALLLLQE